MRARASIIGQLLVVFAVCAGLLGMVAVFGYGGVTRQDATAQLTVRDYQLQHEGRADAGRVRPHPGGGERVRPVRPQG